MKHILSLGITAVMMAGVLGCGSRVRVPPKIDLKLHEVIGIIEFKSSNEGKLASLATRRFTEEARQDQGMVRIVNLGTESEALKAIGRDRLDQGRKRTFIDRGAEPPSGTILTHAPDRDVG